jgi:hypothetical protein
MPWLLLQRKARNLELEGDSGNPQPYSKTRRPMKQTKGTRLDRVFLVKATLLAAMLVPALGLPVYAQQEVDPTWFDPWPTSTKVVVQSKNSRTHNHESRQSTSTVSPRPHSKRTRTKLSGGQQQAVVVAGHSRVK